ncbi:MAG: DUF1329 domain-containing protein, partial [Candidatus Binatia bacterium]
MRWVTTVLAMAFLAATAHAGGDGLQPGMILSHSNWQLAKDLLPPEILAHYKNGEYANPIARWHDGDVRWSAEFLHSTEQNADRLDVSPEGTIIEKSTGRQPRFIYGFPFPRIDAADAHAGVKILWNYFYGYWANGSRRNITAITWLGRASVDRAAVQDVYFFQYDGQPAADRPKENPNNLLQQFVATALRPADLQGTTALTWRYRGTHKRDSNWAYVPALRRVRQVSPANRSDGFLGSDMSQDDGPFFDGKPEDFTWKLVRSQDVLRLADPYSLRGDYTYRPLPGGGWRVPFKPVAMVGFQQPDWKGIAWAPVNFVLVRRPVWVIEGVPHDQYYAFGKIQLYIDKTNFRGAWSRKFDWQGKLSVTYQVASYLNGTPDGGAHYMWGHGLYYQVAEN